MSDPNIERIDKTVTGLTAMYHDLKYSQLAIERILKEILPTMTLEQGKIIQRFGEYKKEMLENALIKVENTNPRLAAILSSILEGHRPL